MWAYRKFSVQPAFFVTLVFAVLWFIYDFLVLLPSHNQMNQLLAHAELGIDAQKFLKPSLFAKHWTPEAWEAMYNADPVVDDVGTGSKLTSKGQIAPGRGSCDVVYVESRNIGYRKYCKKNKQK